MKAQRRHELKTNALDHILEDFPGFMREYGSRILLAIIIAALIVVLVTNWSRGKTERDVRSREAVATARQELGQISQEMVQLLYAGYPSSAIAQFRDTIAKHVSDSVTTAAESDDPKVKAEAQVVKGDLNFLLASLPPLPGSDTQPSLNGELSTDDLLKNARDAYLKVLENPLNQNAAAVRNARFGLASICENNGEWDKAKEYYQQIISDSAVGEPFKELARERLDRLPSLQKPVLLAAPKLDAPASMEGPLGPFLPPSLTTLPSTTS